MHTKILNLPLKWHLVIGTVIRLVLILYADYHDQNYSVPYTDVDYKVFTDAARHVVGHSSPYKRHTYRYSPVISYLMIPNVLWYKNFGKLLFSLFDILVTVAVNILVASYLKDSKNKNSVAISKYSSLLWLYNPLSIAISTRGNADSVPCFIIITSLLFLQTNVVNNLVKYVLCGTFLGVAIHLRLYPIVYSFPMYLTLGDYKINRQTSVLDGLRSLLPNRKQVLLTLSCVCTLFLLTYVMYFLYGYEFLFETYIYHAIRKDTRHNFSVLFYYSYLTSEQLSFDIVKCMSQILECVVLFVLSLAFGTDSKTLPFAMFCQTVVVVAYNGVMTSQYFIWFLSLLPLVVHNFQLSVAKSVSLACIWIGAQGAWLFFAYQLEFLCKDAFVMIWLNGILFFCANLYVLGQLIVCYKPNGTIVKDIRKKVK